MQWSVFCRVVDNYGDIGFAWRLAADLAGRGERVRLAVDDARALAWMAPDGAPGVEVVGWAAGPAPGSDVLVETFGCGFPEGVSAEAEALARLPVCVNVEHLSAEAFVARSHGLASPRFTSRGEAWPTWFFYPGFDAGSGGLLREPGLLQWLDAPGSGDELLARFGIARRDGERIVSLFSYPHAPFDALVDALVEAPTALLLTPGAATEGVLGRLGDRATRGALRAVRLPALRQPDFDLLLASCDLNFVRGEDSLVRAIWAGRPFVWQAYRQSDGAHAAKVEALLGRLLEGGAQPLASAVGGAFRVWNGLAGPASALGPALRRLPEWRLRVRAWRQALAARPDLVTALLDFVASKR